MSVREVHPLLRPKPFGLKPPRKTADELEASIEALTTRMELCDRATVRGAATYRVLECMRGVDQQALDAIKALNHIRFARPMFAARAHAAIGVR
jgi:hypothetical protein